MNFSWSTLHILLLTLSKAEQGQFQEKVLAWSEFDPKQWHIFTGFLLGQVMQGQVLDRAAFLSLWNEYLNIHSHHFKGSLSFLPNSVRGVGVCENAWLDDTLCVLAGLLEDFLILSVMRKTPLYEGLRSKSEQKRADFVQYVRDYGVVEEKGLADFLEPFIAIVVNDNNRGRREFFETWKDSNTVANRYLEHTAAVRLLDQFTGVWELRSIKLCRWLSLMPKSEQAEFLRFLSSSEKRSESRQIRGLVTIFLKDVIVGRGLGRAEVYQKWKHTKTYTKREANILSGKIVRATKLLNRFMVLAEIREDSVVEAALLVKAVARRGWSHSIEHERKKACAVLEKAPKDENYFLHQMQIEESFVKLQLEKRRKWESPPLNLLLQMPEKHFAVQLLRFACAANSYDRITGSQHDFGRFDVFLPFFNSWHSDGGYLIDIYLNIYNMLQAPEEETHFNTLQQLLWSNTEELAPEFAHEILEYLLNHCARRINAGAKQFEEEIHRIFQHTIATNILLTRGQIDSGVFRNKIAIALRYNNVEDADNFFNQYADKVAPNGDPYTIAYNRAVIDYFKRDYSKAIPRLIEVRDYSKDGVNELGACVYLWRILYALNDFKAITEQVDSFRMQINRCKTISKSKLKNYHEFRRMAHKLATICYLYPKEMPQFKVDRNAALQKLARELTALRNCVSYDWLGAEIEKALVL